MSEEEFDINFKVNRLIHVNEESEEDSGDDDDDDDEKGQAHDIFSRIFRKRLYEFFLPNIYLVQLIKHPILRIPNILFVYFLSIF